MATTFPLSVINLVLYHIPCSLTAVTTVSAVPALFVGPRWKSRQDVKDKRGRSKEYGRDGGWRDNGDGVVGVPAR